MSILFADISEHQGSFDARAYRNSGNEVIICRVHNGNRVDHKMPGRMQAIRQVPFVAVGWYLYLVADRDAATQAREACNVIGRLAANEFVVNDHEEGSGNQVARCEAALAVMDAFGGFPATLYAGASFLYEHLGGPKRWRRPLWIASYPGSYSPNPQAYPAEATFWQYSDRAHFTGLTGSNDGNYYPHGAAEFAAAVLGGRKPSAAAPAPEDVQAMALGTLPDGRQEVFVMLKSGEVVHRYNAKEGGWVGWQSLGKPGG